MKSLVRSESGRKIHDRKWQNTDRLKENDQSDDGIQSIKIGQSSDARTPVLTGQDNGSRRSSVVDRLSMYRAALGGDWLAAEILLGRDPSLGRDHITEAGDRALHVAVAMKHEEFVQKLGQRLSPSDLETLHDGHGYTACCYAAVSGIVEIADILMKKNPNLATARDGNNVTPLHKAAFCRNEEMVLYLLKFSKLEDLSKQEWFDLLLVTSQTRMYDVALEILGKDGSLATMRNDEGTILHALARLDISQLRGYKRQASNKGLSRHSHIFTIFTSLFTVRKIDGVMEADLRLLAGKLWAEIQRLEQADVINLIKNPPILHDAAKMGNVELITMLTHIYPNLLWDTNNNGYSIFHIAVIYRRENVFRLIHETGAMKHSTVITQDENGNNILHLAAKLAPPNRTKVAILPAFQMQKDLVWFEEVKAIVPPSCLEMRNKEGQTAREIFSMQHNSMLEKCETWMRDTADSCMLIATVMLTVVVTAAFTVPGGNNQNTGIPLLLKKDLFNMFITYEALALFGSTLSIIMFWFITSSSFEQDQFKHELPSLLTLGFGGLSLSLAGAISAVTSAFFLVFFQERATLAKLITFITYVSLLALTSHKYLKLLYSGSFPKLGRPSSAQTYVRPEKNKSRSRFEKCLNWRSR